MSLYPPQERYSQLRLVVNSRLRFMVSALQVERWPEKANESEDFGGVGETTFEILPQTVPSSHTS